MYFALVRVAVHQLVKFKFSNLIIAYPKSTVKQKHRLPSIAVIARPQAVAIAWYCGQNLYLVPGDCHGLRPRNDSGRGQTVLLLYSGFGVCYNQVRKLEFD